MAMDHMVGDRTPTTLATSFTLSLGEYVYSPSSPLYIVMLALFQLIALQILLVYNLKTQKDFYFNFCILFPFSKNPKPKKLKIFSF
jgi:multisubunit Na+/H+ antiporter MnhF subunit